ncbi:hypothetical protein [Anaerobium acetethylicum]|uniref:Uncharacterized protein n=1 Tax=Anaerobium acetethylicum TaxID=1619234 RepID=A0A1D3TZK6_9FIRM|nr:hypothetical protein [Anaerobium acetethylicum]SCQ00040.1 hypothetical protein SAMN05421730_11032 [Anaerobium acetethylicum]
MSFAFLPWPLYVLMAIGSAIPVLIYVKKMWKTSPKSFYIGLCMVSIGAIIAGIIKFTSNMQVLTQFQEFLKMLTIVCTSSGIILTMIGAYNKVKDDPEKRRIVQIYIGVIIVTIIFIGLIGLSTLK